jgi:hypothetical protein
MGCEAALFWSSARGARWLRQLHPLHSAGRSEWGARRAAGTVWPGERIGAAGEWGERRAGRGDQAGSEWGAKRAAATDRAGPGEAIEAGSEWGARQHSSGASRGELAGFDNSILCTLRAAVNGVRGGPRERCLRRSPAFSTAAHLGRSRPTLSFPHAARRKGASRSARRGCVSM